MLYMQSNITHNMCNYTQGGNTEKKNKKYIKHKVNGLMLQMLLLLVVVYFVGSLLWFVVVSSACYYMPACYATVHACIHACVYQRIMKMKLLFLIQQR